MVGWKIMVYMLKGEYSVLNLAKRLFSYVS